MGATLIRIYRYFESHPEEEFVHVENLLRYSTRIVIKGSNFALLKFWNLLEEEGSLREDGCKNNGYYRLTPLGYKFVKRLAGAHKKVRIYNNRLLNSSDEIVSIDAVLGDKFNYQELMGDRL